MVQYYPYGTVDPSRSRYAPCQHAEPLVYTYVPPQLQQQMANRHPPGPPPPPTPVAAAQAAPPGPPPAQPVTTIQFGMTQQIISNGHYQAGQAITVPYVSPTPLRPSYQVPAGTIPWIGPTRAEVDAQNVAVARATGAYKPQTLIPYRPAEGQQLWCRELDSSYTLRTVTDIMENLQPGYWANSTSGYHYWVRQAAA